MERPFDHILMIGFGGPTRPDQIQPFLKEVARGRKIPEERLKEVEQHYHQIGGCSPYNRHAFRLFEALRAELATEGFLLPIFIGMRNWHPFLKETLTQIQQLGLRQGLVIVLAPHRSEASFERYLQSLEEAKREIGAEAIQYEVVKPWHDHSLFIEAQAQLVRPLLDRLDPEQRKRSSLLFCAHSIPIEMANACRYRQEFRLSSARVAEALEFPRWSLGYCSRSGSVREPWLEPDVLEMLVRLKAQGDQGVILVPIGFLFDHTEVLYDLDGEAKGVAERQGLQFLRASTVMDHPKFIELFKSLIQEKLLELQGQTKGV